MKSTRITLNDHQYKVLEVLSKRQQRSLKKQVLFVIEEYLRLNKKHIYAAEIMTPEEIKKSEENNIKTNIKLDKWEAEEIKYAGNEMPEF